jgi:tetratricopeptide (TPR) repeat protein
MALMALGAFICVLYVGFDAVYDRLATLRDLQDSQGGRFQILKDIALAWTKFPLVGTGLGTHEVVYPMFDRSTIAAIAGHAENEYAQAAEETGLAGLLPLVLFAVLVWRAYIRNICHRHLLVCSAAYGLGFGLLAIMIHSLSDFGQHVPANASLSMIFCALLIALTSARQETVRQSSKPRPLRICVLVVVCGIFTWSLLGANNARLAEAHFKQALVAETDLKENNWQGTNYQYIELIKDAASAVDYQPDNASYRHWLNVYRWYSISRAFDPNTGEALIPQVAMQFIPRIIDELHESIKLCPTFGPSWCFTGQLEMLAADDSVGSEHIQTGFRLAPCDPTVCFVAGLQDAREGKIDRSFEKFTRAIELDGRLFEDVGAVYINQLNRPDLALTIAGDDIGRLSRVANALSGLEEHTELTEQVRIQVTGLLKLKCQQPDAPVGSLASLANIYRRENDNEMAIEYYRRALGLDYGQVNWRFQLAKLLAKTDQLPEAIHEARICLRLRPQYTAAENLIADLSVLSGAMSKETPAP